MHMQWNRITKTLTIFGVVALAGAFAVSQAAGRHRHMGMGDGFGPSPEHIVAFMTDTLDLTDAQQAQAKAILDKEKPNFQPLIQQLADGHKQMRALEESPTFDEPTIRAQATKQAQTMTELIVTKARVKSELFAILTTDQRAKATKLMNRHEERMMHHMQGGPGSAPAGSVPGAGPGI
jgi:Spy/CpxP family protein refolding chaperone